MGRNSKKARSKKANKSNPATADTPPRDHPGVSDEPDSDDDDLLSAQISPFGRATENAAGQRRKPFSRFFANFFLVVSADTLMRCDDFVWARQNRSEPFYPAVIVKVDAKKRAYRYKYFAYEHRGNQLFHKLASSQQIVPDGYARLDLIKNGRAALSGDPLKKDKLEQFNQAVKELEDASYERLPSAPDRIQTKDGDEDDDEHEDEDNEGDGDGIPMTATQATPPDATHKVTSTLLRTVTISEETREQVEEGRPLQRPTRVRGKPKKLIVSTEAHTKTVEKVEETRETVTTTRTKRKRAKNAEEEEETQKEETKKTTKRRRMNKKKMKGEYSTAKVECELSHVLPQVVKEINSETFKSLEFQQYRAMRGSRPDRKQRDIQVSLVEKEPLFALFFY